MERKLFMDRMWIVKRYKSNKKIKEKNGNEVRVWKKDWEEKFWEMGQEDFARKDGVKRRVKIKKILKSWTRLFLVSPNISFEMTTYQISYWL